MDINSTDPDDDIEVVLMHYELRLLTLEHNIADLLDTVFYTDTEYDLAVETQLDVLAALINYADPESP